MMRIFHMMYYTLLEGVRSRIFFITVVFSAFLLLFSRALSALSFSEQERLLFDFGMASLNFCLLLLVIYCGVVLFSQELQARSLMGLLSKPISRGQFIVGKYLGYLGVCFCVLLLLSLVLLSLFYTNNLPINLHFPLAIFGVFSDIAVLLAVLFFFSAVTNSFLALCFTIAVMIMGHSHHTVKYFAELRGDTLMVMLDFLMRYLLPNFEVWNWKDRYYQFNSQVNSQFSLGQVTTTGETANMEILLSFIHAGLWVVVILILTTAIFRRKDCV